MHCLLGLLIRTASCAYSIDRKHTSLFGVNTFAQPIIIPPSTSRTRRLLNWLAITIEPFFTLLMHAAFGDFPLNNFVSNKTSYLTSVLGLARAANFTRTELN